MNFQRPISKDVAGGVPIADAGGGISARRIADGDDFSVGTTIAPQWGSQGAGAQTRTVPSVAGGNPDSAHRPGRRIPDQDIVLVGRRPSDPPSETLRAFRRKLVGFSLAGMLVVGAALHVVRVNNLLGWAPITIDEVVPQYA